MRIKKVKCDKGCGRKAPQSKDSKAGSWTCYHCRRKASRKPKQDAHAAKVAENKLASEQAGVMVVEPPV